MPLMSEILFENKNATVKKVSKETENGAKEYVYLDLLDEKYHDYTPEEIDKLYAYKESLPENKQFIEENKKETLAQVFTDVRYTKKDNEFMSENLLKVLRQQGFLK